ncbi:hypothetical protein CPT_Moby_177 [Stenotrophomonas phage Moby]|uniref:Uncharacterized protein n=1 Tax=Stenotrophomonas phage Moby TaxID=2601680 RepID=A0A5P8PMJ2_9CAUD|nr:hypothetical protein HWC58_gp221 [Stenotrophomonas phage Moby]QFR57902.1 hypothetical protein CPT_Moby_177 [Stenotrophomonas phage Moby]
MSAVLSHTDAAELFIKAHAVRDPVNQIKIEHIFEALANDRDTLSDRKATFITDQDTFKKMLDEDGDLNFLHDIKSGLFICDMYAWHQSVMGTFAEVILGAVKVFPGQHLADKYIEKGLGWFRSSCSYNITISGNIAAPRWTGLEFDYVD